MPAARVVAMSAEESALWTARLRGLAHDLNNALVPLYATVELGKLEGANPRLDELAHRLERLREMARAIAAATPTRATEDDLAAAVHVELATAAMVNGAALRWKVSREAWMELPLRGTNRDHVLRVGVRNALEAMATATPRPDTHRWVEVSHIRDDRGQQLQIRDNGPGCGDVRAIAGGQTRSKPGGHLGIGLAMAARSVEAAGGELWIDADDAGFELQARFRASVA